ncbi:transmembrane protein, putative [Medicago truncatula]|nr:transmembrane protein, putative [Medicago truncatula]
MSGCDINACNKFENRCLIVDVLLNLLLSSEYWKIIIGGILIGFMNTSVCHGSARSIYDRSSGGRGDYSGCGGSDNGGNGRGSGGCSDGGSVDNMNTSVNVGDVGGDGGGQGGWDNVGGGGGGRCGSGIDFLHTSGCWGGNGIDHQFI